MRIRKKSNYRKTSNIRRIKSPNLNESRLVLQLFLPNQLKPGVNQITRPKFVNLRFILVTWVMDYNKPKLKAAEVNAWSKKENPSALFWAPYSLIFSLMTGFILLKTVNYRTMQTTLFMPSVSPGIDDAVACRETNCHNIMEWFPGNGLQANPSEFQSLCCYHLAILITVTYFSVTCYSVESD